MTSDIVESLEFLGGELDDDEPELDDEETKKFVRRARLPTMELDIDDLPAEEPIIID